LIGKDKQTRKVSLIFEGSNVVEEAARFYNGALIKAKAYSDSYRTLKDYISSGDYEERMLWVISRRNIRIPLF